MASFYNPANWYWYVAGDTSKAYSSKLGDYVLSSDTTLVSWIALGNAPTKINNETDLGQVLATPDNITLGITVTSTSLPIQQAFRQTQLDTILTNNADVVKLVQAGQSSTTTGTGLAQFLSTSTNNYRSLRTQIASAATPAAVRAVPINTGWPNNP